MLLLNILFDILNLFIHVTEFLIFEDFDLPYLPFIGEDDCLITFKNINTYTYECLEAFLGDKAKDYDPS